MNQNLEGKCIVITGGSSGIGAAAARALRLAKAKVIITGRSDVTDRLAKEIGAEAFRVDFGQLPDVKRFADTLLARYSRIDTLVNNVGGIFQHRTLTSDGHERTFQVNHLAGFYLTYLLRSRLEESNATVINTSSVANWFGRIDLSDLENSKKYSAARAYGTAKLMNILHAKEITRRFPKINAVAFHPGPVATGFAREGDKFAKLVYQTPLKNIFLITPEKGADTLVWLASTTPNQDWQPGSYYAKRKSRRMNPQAKDAQLAQNLWTASEMLLGLQS